MFVYGKASADNGREPRRLWIGRRKLLRVGIKMSRCSMEPSLIVEKSAVAPLLMRHMCAAGAFVQPGA